MQVFLLWKILYEVLQVGIFLCTVDTSGTSPSVATPVVIESTNADVSDIITINTTHAMVVYSDNTGFNCNATVITVSGTTPSGNTPVNVKSGITGSQFLTVLDSNNILLAFRDNADSDKGKAEILVVA